MVRNSVEEMLNALLEAGADRAAIWTWIDCGRWRPSLHERIFPSPMGDGKRENP